MTKNQVEKNKRKGTDNDYYGSYDAEKVLLTTYIPTAFKEIREKFGLSPKSFRTDNKNKLEKQQKNFLQKHTCPVCGQPKTFIDGTNVMVCKNPECKGFPVKDTEGTIVEYVVPFSELNNRSEAIASAILN